MLRRKFLSVCALIVTTIAGSTLLAIWIDYKASKEERQVKVEDIAKVVEANIFNTIIHTDKTLELVGDIIVADGRSDQMSEPSRLKLLQGYCDTLGGCQVISVVNPEGRIVASSNLYGRPNIDVADRTYFKVPQITKRLFVGPAVVARLPGNPTLFPISRPVYDGSNKLLAIVVAGMNTSHATDFYGSMEFSVRPTVSLYKGNGDLVARHPDMEKYVGKNNANDSLFREQLPRALEGRFEGISGLDGKTRIAAFRSIQDWDLVVFAGIETPIALRPWKERALRNLSIILPVLLVIIALMAYGYRSIIRQVALETENKKLDELSNRDGLTGVANRRLFDTALQREWARHRRSGNHLSILLIDVDCFKAYNDTYGHQAGDECLQKVAQALQDCVHREMDLVARYGGEEFVVLLDSDIDGAMAVAQRMQLQVRSLSIMHAGSTAAPVVTVSIGVANAGCSGAQSAEALLKKADEALYRAKANGRNQVQAAGMVALSSSIVA